MKDKMFHILAMKLNNSNLRTIEKKSKCVEFNFDVNSLWKGFFKCVYRILIIWQFLDYSMMGIYVLWKKNPSMLNLSPM